MREKVTGPAIGLIVVGVLAIGLGLLGLLTSFLDLAFLPSYDDYGGMLPAAVGTAIGLVANVLGMGIGAFQIWAALQMKELRNWTASLIASILAILPCFGCCLVGIPVGIWALVVLVNAEVKEAFTS